MPLSTVRIRDSYADFEGNPISGEVRFYPTADVETSDGVNLLRTSRPIVAPLVDGNLDITLIATDDDSLTPSGWAYYVVEDFEHRPARRPYAIFAPAGELELSDVTPVEPVAEMAAYVRTVNGQEPDANGNVTVTSSVGSVEWSAVTEKPSEFPPEAHTHTVSEVSGLQASLDAKASATHDHAGVYAPASHDHDGVYAPLTHSHPEYAPADHGHSEYAAVSHTHEIADVTGLRTELDDLAEAVEGLETGSGFLTQEEADGLYAASGHNHDALYASVTHNHDGVYAPAAHAHSVADLTDLDLSGKADVDHGHDIADVSGLQSALDGKAAAGHNHDAAYAALGHDHDADYAPVSHGHSISEVSGLQAELDGKAADSHDHDGVYAPAAHNHDGRYALADHDHDGDYAASTHTHSVADLTDLDLSGKADVDHDHVVADVSGLQSALDGKAAVGHNHDAAYAAIGHDHDAEYAAVDHGHDIADVGGLQGALDTKESAGAAAAAVTGHEADVDPHPQYHTDARADVRYYTKSQVDSALAGKASTTHNHDGVYAAASHDHDSAYAPVSHGHEIEDVNGLRAELDNRSPSRRFRPATTGTHFNGNGGSTTLPQIRCRQTRKLLRVIAPGTDALQIEWANIFTVNNPQPNDASCEMPGPNNVTVRMSVEYPAGRPRLVSGSTNYSSGTAYAVGDQVQHSGNQYVCIQPGTGQAPASSPAYWKKVNRYTVRWDGDTDAAGTVVFEPGDYKQSVPIELVEPLVAGEMLAILGAFDTGSSTGRLPVATTGASNVGDWVDWVVDSSTGMPALGSSLPETGVTNQTNGNTTPAGSQYEPDWMRIPWATAVNGTYDGEHCVAVFGDSLLLGGNDDVDAGEFPGALVRALDGIPYWRVSQGGNKTSCYAPGNAPWQMSAIRRCSAVLTDMGINDVQYGLSGETLRANMQRTWKYLSQQGVPVFQFLFTPISSSSDGWASLAGQGQWPVGGSSQFPGGATPYADTAYGSTQLWLSQNGASMLNGLGKTVQAGEKGHPLTGIIDDRALLTDPETGWKWLPGYTADGAHPNGLACSVQSQYLRAALYEHVLTRQYPGWDPIGETPVHSVPRVAAKDLSPANSGSLVTVLGSSDGRYIYGLRWMDGSAAAGTRHWAAFVGLDPSNLKLLGSGSYTSSPNTMHAEFMPGYPVWIPRGYLVVLVLTTPAANAYVGANTANAQMNKTSFNYVLAGTSTRTGSAMTGPLNLRDATASSTRFAAHPFRVWAELA